MHFLTFCGVNVTQPAADFNLIPGIKQRNSPVVEGSLSSSRSRKDTIPIMFVGPLWFAAYYSLSLAQKQIPL